MTFGRSPARSLFLSTLAALLTSCGDDGPAGPGETPQNAVPQAWVGTWTGTETLTDCTTGEHGTEPSTLRLCLGATPAQIVFGPGTQATCTGGFTSTTWTVDCSGAVLDLGCQRGAYASGTLTLNGTRITGTLEMRTTDTDPSPDCTNPAECTRVVLDLNRTSPSCGSAAVPDGPGLLRSALCAARGW